MTTSALNRRLLTTAEVADYLRLPVATLHRWRHGGVGPEAMRIGRHLRYEVADVDRWLMENKKPVQRKDNARR